MEYTGVILAGGNSSRMGKDKALVNFRGKSLLEHSIEILEPLCKEIIISSNSLKYAFSNYPVYPDMIRAIGPAGGLYTGLIRAKYQNCMFISVDSPFIPSALFEYLKSRAQQFDISIPIQNQAIEPMIGIYSKKCIPSFEKAFRNKMYSPPKIIKSCSYQFVEISPYLPFYQPNLFFNINSPEDLEKANKTPKTR